MKNKVKINEAVCVAVNKDSAGWLTIAKLEDLRADGGLLAAKMKGKKGDDIYEVEILHVFLGGSFMRVKVPKAAIGIPVRATLEDDTIYYGAAPLDTDFDLSPPEKLYFVSAPEKPTRKTEPIKDWKDA